MIEFTEEMEAAIASAVEDRVFMIIATASKDGAPDIAYKASAMTWGNDHIAFWERALGTTYRNLLENPQCCLMYTNFAKRMGWKFFGMAEVFTEGDVRQQVMDKTIQFELDQDPERKGAAVIVRIDQIKRGPQVIQQRDGVAAG